MITVKTPLNQQVTGQRLVYIGVQCCLLACSPVPPQGSPIAPTLELGQWVVDPSDTYLLIMDNENFRGSLVLYRITGGSLSSGVVDVRLIWSSNTSNGQFAVAQGDGNLVVYEGQGTAVWDSGTSGNQAQFLSLQSDGNLVVYGFPCIWNLGPQSS